MHAVGFQQPGRIDRETALTDIELPTPKAEGRDLLVEVKAVSVNPVDTKMRKGAEPAQGTQPAPGAWQVLGWDAAGVVAAVGPAVTLFRPGDALNPTSRLGGIKSCGTLRWGPAGIWADGRTGVVLSNY
jgi:NADPH:quinone reductase